MTELSYWDRETLLETLRAMHDAEDGVRGTLLRLHWLGWPRAKASAGLAGFVDGGHVVIRRGRVLLTKYGRAHLRPDDPRVVSQAVPADWRRDWDEWLLVLRLRRARRRRQSRDIHE